MDRRGFLGLIGCGAGAVVLGPLLPVSEPVGLTKVILPLEYTGDAYRQIYMGAAGGGKTNMFAAQRYYNAAWNQILDHRDLTTNPTFTPGSPTTRFECLTA